MRKAKWHVLFICLAVSASILLAGCGSNNQPVAQEQGEATTQEKILTISWGQDMGELNPHMYSPNQMFAQDMVYESLVRYGEDGEIQPKLAEDWEISPDGKEYTFKLRKDVKFSDGSSFNAAIAKKNFDVVLSNAERHNWLELINQIEATEVVEEYTLKLVFKNPYYPALQELALIRPLRFLGEAGFPDNGNTAEGIKQAIGTGPWVFSEEVKGEYAVFTKNEHYWGAEPKVDKIVIKIIPDAETRAMAFEKKEIDLIYGSGLISLDSFKQFRDSGKYKTDISNPLATRFLAINSNKGATKELEVRRAIQHAFDKQTFIDAVFYGTEKKADTLFASNFPYCDLGLEAYDYNLEKASLLLEEAGWKKGEGKEFREKNGQLLEMEFNFDSDDAIQKSIGEVLQGDLKKAGIKLNLVGEETASYAQRQKDGNFNLIYESNWGAPYDPHSFVSSMRTPAHADYQAQIGLPMKSEIDAKITEVLLSTNEEERQELYAYILETLHEQAVYLPISYRSNIAVHHDYVSGVVFFGTQYEMPLANIDL
ncbi:nickel transport system substrate-binding protein [Anaerovirgula multivorans]|uniref:Nickel transport system substrate-binding protein n=1 Tax=Anaerovirgula multivorans TaxID=312168 RepID=A0A239IKF9_9FIRM|nr:nickel ABC transporter substrate-binding protein [Anaerovirgula multivorans]SNS93718.1 nickel transport system substrate-binding protein [Anaerovirgula multivorans]